MKKSLFSMAFMVAFTTSIYAQAPFVSFSADTTSGCDSLLVKFTGFIFGSANTFFWDFGDGNTSNQQNPSHKYSTKGIFTVKFTAGNSQGANTAVQNNFVELVECNSGCDSFVVDPIFAPGPGVHQISAIATFADGTTKDIILTVNVPACPPGSNVGDLIFSDYNWNQAGNSAEVCVGEPITLTCTKDALNYDWHQVPSVGNHQTVTITKNQPGTYTIFLEVWNVVGSIPTKIWFTLYATNCFTGNDDPNAKKIVVKVSPNPSSGYFTVEVPEGVHETTITDVAGREINKSNENGSLSFDLSKEPAGVYFLVAKSDNGRNIVEKIVKQ